MFQTLSINIDTGINDTLSKLKFIGKIQKGEKINVRYMYVQPDSWITRLSRTFFATDNRMSAYHFIEGVVNRGFDIIKLYKNSFRVSEKHLVENIIKDLNSCIQGIGNLKETYSCDVMFCCKLDTLIQDISSRLSELEYDIENEDNDIDSVD